GTVLVVAAVWVVMDSAGARVTRSAHGLGSGRAHVVDLVGLGDGDARALWEAVDHAGAVLARRRGLRAGIRIDLDGHGAGAADRREGQQGDASAVDRLTVDLDGGGVARAEVLDGADDRDG